MEMNRYYPGPDGVIVKSEVHFGFPYFVRRGGSSTCFFVPVHDVVKENVVGSCLDKEVRNTFENPVVPDCKSSNLIAAVPSYQRGSDGKVLPLSAVFKNWNTASEW